MENQQPGHEEQASDAFVHQPRFGETNDASSLDSLVDSFLFQKLSFLEVG